jgi:hypothetical protein
VSDQGRLASGASGVNHWQHKEAVAATTMFAAFAELRTLAPGHGVTPLLICGATGAELVTSEFEEVTLKLPARRPGRDIFHIRALPGERAKLLRDFARKLAADVIFGWANESTVDFRPHSKRLASLHAASLYCGIPEYSLSPTAMDIVEFLRGMPGAPKRWTLHLDDDPYVTLDNRYTIPLGPLAGVMGLRPVLHFLLSDLSEAIELGRGQVHQFWGEPAKLSDAMSCMRAVNALGLTAAETESVLGFASAHLSLDQLFGPARPF